MKSLVSIIIMLAVKTVAAQVPVWKFSDLEKYARDHDTVLVINFWATWCKPCVKELPHFEAAREHFKDKPVKFLLVSLDFKRELDTRVTPFVKSKKIQAPVVLLDEPDYNSWINKVDSSWSGAIPGTLFIDTKGNRKFMETEFEKEQLFKHIEAMLLRKD